MTPWIVCASTLTILISANGAAAQTGSALYSTRLDTRVTTSAFLVTFGTTYLLLRNPSPFFSRMLDVTGVREGLNIAD